MKTEKVFLQIETPFSLRNPQTRQKALLVSCLFLVTPVLMARLVLTNLDNMVYVQWMTITFIIWLVMGAIPIALIIFNSYAMAADGDLIVNPLGFYQKRYPRHTLQRAAHTKVKGTVRISIFADGKCVVSMPDGDAARNLVGSLRIPTELDTP